MLKIIVHIEENKWVSSVNEEGAILRTKGVVFLNNKILNNSQISNFLNKHESIKALEPKLRQLNGHYGWINYTADRLLAGVDHIRSYPLFYGLMGDSFFLSDNAEWVRKNLGENRSTKSSKDEFLSTGYVSGNKTLFNGLKQLRAGELIEVTKINDTLHVETKHFYEFKHKEPLHYDQSEFYISLQKILHRSIRRLLEYADGRQIVIPLSGGFDSRIVATYIKRLNYKNVKTFTYGKRGINEVKYSRQVANLLGLDWEFVAYDEKLWREAWQNEQRKKYQFWAANWAALPILQDWLAVKILHEKKLVDQNCIFVPGHTGDFISGGHIPNDTFSKKQFSKDDVIQAIFSRHYKHTPVEIQNRWKDVWCEEISHSLEQFEIQTNYNYADAIEYWGWQERQAKFICNSVRAYEFFGYDWWMPLWDKELIDFWTNVPLQLRQERKWFKDFITKEFNSEIGVDSSIGKRNASDLSIPILKIAKILPKPIRAYIWSLVNMKSSYVFEGRFNKKEYQKLNNEGYSPTGVHAHFVLEELGLQTESADK